MKKGVGYALIVLVTVGFATGSPASSLAQASSSSGELLSPAALAPAVTPNGWLAMGSSGFAKTASSSQIDLPNTTSFTIEGWFELGSSWGWTQSNGVFLFKQENSGEGISIDKTCGFTPPITCSTKITYWGANSGSGYTISSSIGPGWNHFALVNDMDSNQTRTYINGDLVNTRNSTFSLATGTNLLLGCYRSDGCLGRPLAMDEWRVSDAIRYTTGFTPTMTAFACDDTTPALWHFNEIEGATVFHDACGTEDNFLTAVNDAHAEGIPGSWVYLPLLVR